MVTKTSLNRDETWFSPAVWLLAALVVILLILKIFIANQLATTGVAANSNSSELNKLKAENQQLSNEVSTLGSIQRVSAAAAKLGLKSQPKVELLRTEPSVALQR